MSAQTLIFHHGLLDDRLHCLEDARLVAELTGGGLVVESDQKQLEEVLADFATHPNGRQRLGWDTTQRLQKCLRNMENGWFSDSVVGMLPYRVYVNVHRIGL